MAPTTFIVRGGAGAMAVSRTGLGDCRRSVVVSSLLVEIALELPDPHRPQRVADPGTGSGAIAAPVTSERTAWQVIATDRSAAAPACANLRRFGLANDRGVVCGGPAAPHWGAAQMLGRIGLGDLGHPLGEVNAIAAGPPMRLAA